MNELFSAIIKYLAEHEDASTFRTLCVGGIFKHFAPHDTENPWLVVSMDTPEANTHEVMHSKDDQLMYSDIDVKFAFYTTVDLPEGHDQISTAMDALDAIMDDNLLDMAGYDMTHTRVLSGVRERRFIYPDPDGGWTGHVFIRYQYGNK